MADLWLNDPTLFLYYRPNDEGNTPVRYIWRCSKVTSPLPLQRSDFTVHRTQVVGPQSLVGRHVCWSRGNYDGLIAYISSRRLLVNSEGLVFEEIYKVEEDGSVNVKEHIYVRWLEVLNMEAYGFKTQDVPYKNAEYLGKASSPLAVCSPPPPNDNDETVVVKKLIADLAALTSKFAGLEAEKTKLSTDLAKVTTDVATLTKDLNYEKNEKTKLSTDLAKVNTDVGTLTEDLNKEKKEKTKLSADVATLTQDLNQEKTERDDLKKTLAGLQVKIDEIKESQPPAWMNDFGCGKSDWIAIDDPTVRIYEYQQSDWNISSTPAASSTTSEAADSCNVRASYMFDAVYISDRSSNKSYKLIKVDNLTNNEKLRFRRGAWGVANIGGVGRVLHKYCS